MFHPFALLKSVGLGAGLMYLFDPQQGNRRRAQLSDRIRSEFNCLTDAVDVGVRDMQNRLQGTMHEVNSALEGRKSPTEVAAKMIRPTWSPAARLVVGSLGAAWMGKCLLSRSPMAMLQGAAGLAMFMKAMDDPRGGQGQGWMQQAGDMLKQGMEHATGSQQESGDTQAEETPESGERASLDASEGVDQDQMQHDDQMNQDQMNQGQMSGQASGQMTDEAGGPESLGSPHQGTQGEGTEENGSQRAQGAAGSQQPTQAM